MIWESYYWKTPLLRMAKRLRSFKTASDLSEKQLVQIERDIFIGFYSVRKLFESGLKMTDATKAMQIPISWHANCEPVTWINNHRIDEIYDFDKACQETREIKFIASIIIHSFVFAPCIGDNGLEGILFTSDTDKNKKIYYMTVDDVITIFERVGNDYPTEIHIRANDETGGFTAEVIGSRPRRRNDPRRRLIPL
jgi:hypothetical protein